MPKVFVTGCFDLLHSGHVAFLQEAASLGELTVCIGSDETVYALKRRAPTNSQDERAFMVQAIKGVHRVLVGSGKGRIDFLDELDSVRPTIFFVNHDGHHEEKEALCRERGITYVVRERKPFGELDATSTTAIRSECHLPFRLDLAGGWLDQPFVSKIHPGPVLTISIEPDPAFGSRSGLSGSTRETAKALWGHRLPPGNPERLARTLFCCENPPGSPYISGSQDSIGLVYPGLSRLNYNGFYWPETIETCEDEQVLRFLEDALQLISLGPRPESFDPLVDTRITLSEAKKLAEAANGFWSAALRLELAPMIQAMNSSREAQIAMFPRMQDTEVARQIADFCAQGYGVKMSGAGGAGYLALLGGAKIEHSLGLKIRRSAGF